MAIVFNAQNFTYDKGPGDSVYSLVYLPAAKHGAPKKAFERRPFLGGHFVFHVYARGGALRVGILVLVLVKIFMA